MVTPKVRIKIEPDTKALFDWFDRVLDPAINKAAIVAVNKTAEDIIKAAEQLVPVDEGDLRSTLRKTKWRKARGLFARVYVVAGGIKGKVTGKIVDYAGFVEFGTSTQRPQPYLRPAFRKKMKNFFEHFLVAYNGGFR